MSNNHNRDRPRQTTPLTNFGFTTPVAVNPSPGRHTPTTGGYHAPAAVDPNTIATIQEWRGERYGSPQAGSANDGGPAVFRSSRREDVSTAVAEVTNPRPDPSPLVPLVPPVAVPAPDVTQPVAPPVVVPPRVVATPVSVAPTPVVVPAQIAKKRRLLSGLKLNYPSPRVPERVSGPRKSAKRSVDRLEGAKGSTRVASPAPTGAGDAARRGAKPPKSALQDAKRRAEPKSAGPSSRTIKESSPKKVRDDRPGPHTSKASSPKTVREDIRCGRPDDNKPKGGGGGSKAFVPWQKKGGKC